MGEPAFSATVAAMHQHDYCTSSRPAARLRVRATVEESSVPAAAGTHRYYRYGSDYSYYNVLE